jgi:hypothetical protein
MKRQLFSILALTFACTMVQAGQDRGGGSSYLNPPQLLKLAKARLAARLEAADASLFEEMVPANVSEDRATSAREWMIHVVLNTREEPDRSETWVNCRNGRTEPKSFDYESGKKGYSISVLNKFYEHYAAVPVFASGTSDKSVRDAFVSEIELRLIHEISHRWIESGECADESSEQFAQLFFDKLPRISSEAVTSANSTNRMKRLIDASKRSAAYADMALGLSRQGKSCVILSLESARAFETCNLSFEMAKWITYQAYAEISGIALSQLTEETVIDQIKLDDQAWMNDHHHTVQGSTAFQMVVYFMLNSVVRNTGSTYEIDLNQDTIGEHPTLGEFAKFLYEDGYTTQKRANSNVREQFTYRWVNKGR